MAKTFSTLFIAVIGFSIAALFLATLEGAGGTKRAFIIELIGAGSYLFAANHLTSESNGQYLPIEVIWRVEWVYFTLIGIGSYLMLRNGNWKKGLESLSEAKE
jgi:Na+-driven multidrug efflux pump